MEVQLFPSSCPLLPMAFTCSEDPVTRVTNALNSQAHKAIPDFFHKTSLWFLPHPAGERHTFPSPCPKGGNNFLPGNWVPKSPTNSFNHVSIGWGDCLRSKPCKMCVASVQFLCSVDLLPGFFQRQPEKFWEYSLVYTQLLFIALIICLFSHTVIYLQAGACFEA